MEADKDGDPVDWEDVEDDFVTAAIAAGDATGWFEELFAAGADGRITMPWSRTDAHPLLVDWARAAGLDGGGSTAVVVGCGLGADAEFVADLGFATSAFDVSPTAIRVAQERHPDSAVRYVVADLLDLPAEWRRAFDLVVEIITLQALPPSLHAHAGARVRELVAPGGTLLVIGATPVAAAPVPPWPLTREELEGIAGDGLTVTTVETVGMPGRPAEPRWRAVYRRE